MFSYGGLFFLFNLYFGRRFHLLSISRFLRSLIRLSLCLERQPQEVLFVHFFSSVFSRELTVFFSSMVALFLYHLAAAGSAGFFVGVMETTPVGLMFVLVIGS